MCRILGALSKLDEFLSNPQIRTHSGTVPGTFQNTKVEKQEPKEDRSQDDPHPEVGPSVYQSLLSNDSDSDEAPHMVTGVQEENRYRIDSVTGFQDEIPCCSLGLLLENKRWRSSQVSQNLTVRTPL